jgi:hypothetical protein
MRCILHIGVEKTGTTSIQQFLAGNRKALLQSGCLTPVLTGNGGHSALCVACSGSYRDDDLCRYAWVSSEDAWQGFRGELLAVLKREIRDSGDLDALVFSSEHIQSRLRGVEELENLKSFLGEAGATSIGVLVYLRDPAEIAGSLYSTSVKYGSKALDAPPPQNGYYRNVCHHQETLERFCAVFGEDAVVPRLFVPEEFAGGSVVDDFCESAGLDRTLCAGLVERSNPALSRTGIELLRRLNDDVPVFVEGRANPARRKILRFLEENFSQPPYRLSEEMRERYAREFAASNEWVRKRYFPEREELFPRRQEEAGQVEGLPGMDWEIIDSLLKEAW